MDFWILSELHKRYICIALCMYPQEYPHADYVWLHIADTLPVKRA